MLAFLYLAFIVSLVRDELLLAVKLMRRLLSGRGSQADSDTTSLDGKSYDGLYIEGLSVGLVDNDSLADDRVGLGALLPSEADDGQSDDGASVVSGGVSSSDGDEPVRDDG